MDSGQACAKLKANAQRGAEQGISKLFRDNKSSVGGE